MRRLLVTALGVVGELVGPASCAGCDIAVPHGTAFCLACSGTLVRAPNPRADRVAAFVYGGAIADAIRKLKFDDRPDLATPLAASFGRLVPGFRGEGLGVVVPVPLHPSRLVERGYNQASLLARNLARRLDVPFAPRALGRRLVTSRQSDLSREARVTNVAGAFAPVDPRGVSGQAVLLVDDVETTGTTLDACCDALRAAGARSIVSAVVARAELAHTPSR